MKTIKLFILLFLCIASWQVDLAQETEDYTKFVDSKNEWTYLKILYGNQGVVSLTTQNVYLEGDSLANFTSYKKVYSYYMKLESKSFFGLVREEMQKVYFMYSDDEKEYLIYDFSLEKDDFLILEDPNGEEYEDKILQAKEVDYIDLNGESRKRIQLGYEENDNIIETWIEGVGSLMYFTNNLFLNPGTSPRLLCYAYDEEILYHDTEYPECYYDYTTTDLFLLDENRILVFPNPVNNLLNITGEEGFWMVEMYDTTGKVVHKMDFSDLKYQYSLNIENFPKGVYSLIVRNVGNNIIMSKIIKQ